MAEFKSMFDAAAVCPTPDVSGDGVEKYGGYDLPEGRAATPSQPNLPQVTFVRSMPGGPAEGDTVRLTDVGVIEGASTRPGLVLPKGG